MNDRTLGSAKLEPDTSTPKRRIKVVRTRSAAAPASAPTVRDRVTTLELPRLAASWHLDCEARGHSARSIESNRFVTDKLTWWLRREKRGWCGSDELREFQIYVRTAHELPEGRWGEKGDRPDDPQGRGHSRAQLHKPVSSRTLKNYWSWLRTFFNWLVAEDVLTVSPFERMQPPIHRADQIHPFTAEQINLLLEAAKSSRQPRRDTALVLFLLDTGVRASEIVALTWGDVDLPARRGIVLGKGGKKRAVYWSGETGRALRNYIREVGREPEDPLFASESGNTPGAALTRGGLLKIIARLGHAAGIEVTRCSPHTFRHTFASMYLNQGGSQASLMERLGHTRPDMTMRYVHFAGADSANQARQFSPVAALKKR